MPLPQDIVDLIERFARNIDAYKTGRYNETQLRREFIDPFFTALGWDIDNRAGHAEAYKDVIHEDAIKIGAATKAPDYCFRIGGTRKFFIEAKKPSIDIKGDPHPAFQLRRYAWSAKLPLSILTDFEEFAVYDCRIRPKKTDRASTARVKYIKYTEYPERWDEIESIFSHDAILKGSFDKYAQSAKRKKGTAEVDSAFLAEIERWRENLAKNLALRNPDLTNRQLNFGVQKTIDRIIFLRIAEDRGLERYGELLTLCNGRDVYARLLALFRKADARYNSGLFHFHQEKDRPEGPDELTPGLAIDDAVLKDIFKSLYYPDSPYEFSVLPAEILGHVYEQFLGKVITLTPAHRAKIEEKPEVKKAGGIYYTPAYIVDYIVENTVAKLLESRTVKHFKTRPPRMDSPLTICDPACGSGSFLLGAYQHLLDWHLKHYTENNPDQWLKSTNPPITETVRAWQATPSPSTAPNPTPLSSRAQSRDPLNQTPPKAAQQNSKSQIVNSKSYKLTVSERKRILLDHIYGVDIDPQAVEVTKLSLLLKVLEGEKSEMLFATERALPDLANNIKCGNSLIAPDFYQNTQLTLFDEEQRYKTNAFDWESEFPQIFNTKKPGFEAVMGNPPYIRIQTLKDTQPEGVTYFSEHYKAASKGNYDIYVVFVEKALGLLNNQGKLGYILPHKFFNAKYGQPLRRLITAGKHLSHIVHFGDQQVFSGATTYTCLLFLARKSSAQFNVAKVSNIITWRTDHVSTIGNIDATHATDSEWNFVVGPGTALYNKLSSMPTHLGDIAYIFVGLQTSADTVFLFKDYHLSSPDYMEVFSKELKETVHVEADLLRPVVRSGSIGRYSSQPTAYVLFPYERHQAKFRLIPEADFPSRYPKTWAYLLRNKRLLSNREHGKFRDTGWYQLYPKNLDVWDQPKLMLPYMVTRLSAHFDTCNTYFVNVTTGGFGVTLTEPFFALEYLAGLINSLLMDWYLKQVSTHFHGGYFAANKQFLVQLPIRMLNLTAPTDKSRHDKVVVLVQTMLELNKTLQNTRTPDEKTALQRQITATDNQIDQLVYELYNLTEEEIEIVEAANR